MARIPVGGNGNGGNYIKWDDVAPGTEYEGQFLGLRDGRVGALVDLQTEDGLLTFSAPTVLRRKLQAVRVGAHDVTILYKGKPRSEKSGREYLDHDVFVADEGDMVKL